MHGAGTAAVSWPAAVTRRQGPTAARRRWPPVPSIGSIDPVAAKVTCDRPAPGGGRPPGGRSSRRCTAGRREARRAWPPLVPGGPVGAVEDPHERGKHQLRALPPTRGRKSLPTGGPLSSECSKERFTGTMTQTSGVPRAPSGTALPLPGAGRPAGRPDAAGRGSPGCRPPPRGHAPAPGEVGGDPVPPAPDRVRPPVPAHPAGGTAESSGVRTASARAVSQTATATAPGSGQPTARSPR